MYATEYTGWCRNFYLLITQVRKYLRSLAKNFTFCGRAQFSTCT